MTELKADVFIVGAGPSGLVLAYQLNRLGVTTVIVDSADKASPEFPMYGRASTLYPRTLEMLDQLDLYEDMAQEGLVSGRYFSYRDGKRNYGRGWTLFGSPEGTYFPYVMNLRLKYSEDIFREKLAELGTQVHAPLKLVALQVDDSAAADEYKVSASCVAPDGAETKIRAKYVVGTDGGSSTVRKLAEIPFEGDSTGEHWVRMDGIVKTNLPESRNGTGTLDHPVYGNVLWISLDHGATRIGYAVTPEMYEQYGHTMTKEQAIFEAKRAVEPFELEFEELHWHTLYSIGQRVAQRLLSNERILLAGDAGHTHSSGSAQGMNTGMHDVVSLGWRLAGVLNGWYQPEVLGNYSDERIEVARELIRQDKIVSALISGHRPEHMKDLPETTPQLLSRAIAENIGFIDGLQISYPANLLNDSEHALPSVHFAPGHRPHDALLRKPGFNKQTTRLFEVTKNNGKFHVIIFTGKAALTQSLLKSLRAQVDQHVSQFQHAVDMLTIVDGNGYAVDEHLGVAKFGKAYWDADSSAHETYCVSANQGAIVVLRPDGIVGATADLDGFAETIVPYLSRVVIPRAVVKDAREKTGANFGELINQFDPITSKTS